MIQESRIHSNMPRIPQARSSRSNVPICLWIFSFLCIFWSRGPKMVTKSMAVSTGAVSGVMTFRKK